MLCLREARHERDHGSCCEDHAGQVEAWSSALPALKAQQTGSRDERSQGDRDVDEEDPAPPREAGRRAAEYHAGCEAKRGYDAEHAQSTIPLITLREL